MISSKVGSPVTGKDFFDREHEQSRIWEDLRGDDILLLAPRRVGKTSLMLRLRDTAKARDLEAAYLSVADATDEVAFVRKLYEAVLELPSASRLQRLAKGPAGKILKRIRKFKGVEWGEGNAWDDLGTALAKALDQHEGRRLILIDEVPVFVLTLIREDPSAERARRFLSWFRDLRQQPDRQGHLHWLLAGSIGLDTVTARLRLGDTINDLYLVRLGAFERQTARRFFKELSQSHGFSIPDDVLEHALDRIGWLIPYYLQLLFRELRNACRGEDANPSVAIVDRVFDDLLSAPKRGYFDYWRQRLVDELGQPDSGLALLLLNTIAMDPRGASRATMSQALGERIQEPEEKSNRLRFLIDVLESDGYVAHHDDRYVFRSPLLREFWLRRVVP